MMGFREDQKKSQIRQALQCINIALPWSRLYTKHHNQQHGKNQHDRMKCEDVLTNAHG